MSNDHSLPPITANEELNTFLFRDAETGCLNMLNLKRKINQQKHCRIVILSNDKNLKKSIKKKFIVQVKNIRQQRDMPFYEVLL